MPSIFGPITKRLLGKFDKSSSGWSPPGHDPHTPKGGKLPKGVSGTRVGGKPGRKSGK